MDPLSVTASIIAILQLTSSATKAFQDLRFLCKSLPGRLHALSNEVSDIDLVLQEVGSIAKDRSTDSIFRANNSSLEKILKQAFNRLSEVNSIVLRLIEVSQSARSSLFAAHAWKKNQPRLQSLQEELQTIKCNLNILLGTYHTQDVMRIRVDIESFYTSTASSFQDSASAQAEIERKLEHNRIDVHDAIDAIYQRVDKRISNVEDLLRESQSRFQDRDQDKIQMASSIDTSQLLLLRSRQAPRPSLALRRKSNNSHLGGEVACLRARRSRPCTVECTCRCHGQTAHMIPKFADRVLGQLFVGYAGLPALSKRCNVESCEKSKSSQMTIEYWFPLSFIWSQIFRLRLAYSPNIGPQFELSTLRRVPDSAPCVHLALQGDIEGLKDLFNRGLASPRDVSSTRGYSVLRWAVYGHQYQTAKFLLQAGADPDYRPLAAHDNSPRHKANQFLLMGGISDDDADALRSLTEGGDFIDEQNYTSLHKIILGLVGYDLEHELLLHPELLDIPDAMGRTPLIWAACRGDARAVVLLLQHGAEVNILDIQHTNALSYAAERDFAICVRLLLEAGADPNIAETNHLPAADAINVAVRNASDPLIIKSLLDFGANPDSSGVDCMTGLIHAARRDKVDFALLLLEQNANINAMSVFNQTPLTTAVTYNSHHVLSLLLERWFEYSECPRLKGPHLLKVVADYADIETIQMLASTDHLLIKYDKEYTSTDFKSALKNRAGADEELIHAFAELHEVVRQESLSNRVHSLHSDKRCSRPDQYASSQNADAMESGLLNTDEQEAKELMQRATERDGPDTDDDNEFYDALDVLSLANP